MPFSTLFERREKERELERLQVIEEVKRAATALRARFAYDELLLFGSLVSGKFDRHSDIDLAVKGLASEHFFKACAFLMHEISGNHDLDLKPYENLRRRIDGEGIRIG
ncbi:MAG: nucleotidyltransferase domain-containing protein [Spirochaetes bacterium]|nr:nucleotidyltransferase domain-containing protein [Spirochaetota bacterium]